MKNSKRLNELINRIKWCKIPVFDKRDNNRRRTLLITKPEFISDIKNKNKCAALDLIPILMFRKDNYEIHHVIIVQIDNGINVGISLLYDSRANRANITGIHIDKSLLIKAHQWISTQHRKECECFDNFNSTINHLSVGNPDDDQNKINALKKDLIELKRNMKETVINQKFNDGFSSSSYVSCSDSDSK